jgi:hypothetical protein
MITDEDIEAAANFIRDNAKHYAKAKSERMYLEQFRKTKKALLMNTSHGSDKTREAYAYAHEDYIQLLEGMRVAREEEERLRWLMVSAEHKIDLWRTQQANNRKIEYSHR